MSSHQDYIRKILAHNGINVNDPNFLETPTRWLKFIEHYTQPYNAAEDLGVTFPVKAGASGGQVYGRAMIVQTGIPFRAMCAHHLIPVLGTAHVGYIPGDRVVGLSKLTRIVHGFSHASPSLQEDVCNSIVDALMEFLKPIGAMCVIHAEHGCMAARGVEEASGCIQTATASVRGAFINKVEAREEFYHLIGASR